MLGQGASAITATVAGNAGQLLQSGGALADPAYTTATYPATTAQGDLLLSATANTITALNKNTTATRYLANTGANNNAQWDVVNVGNGVTGVLLPVNGGSGVASPSAHTLLVGEGTAAFNQVGPGSAGQVVVSGGASADPGYVTPTTGTGLTGTFNASTHQYALVTPVATGNGGTNVSSAGAVGNVLTSNGSDWISSPPTSGPPSSLVATSMDFVDDFFWAGVNALANNSTIGPWHCLIANTGGIIAQPRTQVTGRGNLRLSTLVSSTGQSGINQWGGDSGTSADYLIGNGIFIITFYFRAGSVSSSSQRYNILFGLTDVNTLNTAPTNGIWLSYSDNVNSGNYVINTIKASTPTNTNTSKAFATPQVVQIVVNAAGTSVEFFVGSVTSNLASIGVIATANIPSTNQNLTPFFYLAKTVGSIESYVDIDLITIHKDCVR